MWAFQLYIIIMSIIIIYNIQYSFREKGSLRFPCTMAFLKIMMNISTYMVNIFIHICIYWDIKVRYCLTRKMTRLYMKRSLSIDFLNRKIYKKEIKNKMIKNFFFFKYGKLYRISWRCLTTFSNLPLGKTCLYLLSHK